MDLSIIILSYNTKELTINCISSILSQYKKELDEKKFEIIVLDNASEDGSSKAILNLKIPNLNLIESKENLGFSNGNNVASKKAKGDKFMFLNSDTEIKDQGIIKMIDFIDKNEKVGILGGKLKNPDGSDQPSVGEFYDLPKLFLMLLGFQRFGFLVSSPSKPQEVDWVSGASLMIRKKVFERVGGFEEKLFMYMEDVELCYKAKNKGFATYFFPEILIFHKERGSGNRTFSIVQIYKGVLFFYKKHKPNWQYQIAKFMLKSKAIVLLVIGKIINNKYLKDTYQQALSV